MWLISLRRIQILPIDFINLFMDRFSGLLDKLEFHPILFVLLDEFASFQSPEYLNIFVSNIGPYLLKNIELLSSEELITLSSAIEFIYVTYKGDNLSGIMDLAMISLENTMNQLKENEGEIYYPCIIQLLNRIILQNDVFTNECINNKSKLEWSLKYMLKKSLYPLDYFLARGYVLSIIKLYYLFRSNIELSQYVPLIGNEKYFEYFFEKVEDVIQKLNQSESPQHWLYNPEELAEEDLLNEGDVK